MTDDNMTSERESGGRTSRPDSVDGPWDPETDETDWWAGERVLDGDPRSKRPKRIVTVVALLTVAGFGAATFVSTGETRVPATTVPRVTTTLVADE